MRHFTSNHRKLHALAYRADGGALFACASEPFKPFPEGAMRGLERWALDGDGEPDPISATDEDERAARWLLPMPDGRLVLPGSLDRQGYRHQFPAVLLDPTGGRPPLIFATLCATAMPSATVSPDGESLVLVGHLDRMGRPGIVCYRLPVSNRDQPVWIREVSEPGESNAASISGVQFAPDGERLLTLETDRVPNEAPRHPWQQQTYHFTRTFRWRSVTDGRLLPWKGKPVILPSSTSKVKLASSGSRLILLYGKNLVSYETARPTRNSVRTMSETTKQFTDIAIHPDGCRVFATCNDETVREYDAVTLQELRAYAWQIGRLRCVAIAPDGLTAAAGSDTGKVVVWDLE